MDVERGLVLALLIAVALVPPFVASRVFLWVLGRWRPISKPRRLVVHGAVFAAWALVLTYFTMGFGFLGAPPTMPAFPWPPPPASAEAVIPDRWLRTGATVDLASVARTFESALRAAHYREWSYSSVPNGFALVCQFEQINADGTPSPGSARWSTDLPQVASMSLMEFVRALTGASPGYYRVFVFIATDQPWSRTGEKPSGRAAEEWLAKGFVWLPEDIGIQPYGSNHRTRALVYEFQKASKEANATLLKPSPTSAEDHLAKAGISDWLSRQ